MSCRKGGSSVSKEKLRRASAFPAGLAVLTVMHPAGCPEVRLRRVWVFDETGAAVTYSDIQITVEGSIVSDIVSGDMWV